ncbi:MAG: UDP-N-acetylmuramoyl-tripeptide--D-alanyl-D-alanine ligase [Candidatus Nomurabacteria bacterium]|nr:UDP-N-acetylmuramoyl-tripeptide--D-alanyl-D-alanine ligase [Candidatus Nomurabacteria bacterium]
MKTIFKKIIAYILQIESRLVLFRYKPKIIAITGSVGKTSTKDAVYAVLSKVSHVRKANKNYNSEIGLPLTILGIPNGWNNPFIWLLNVLKGLWLFINPFKSSQYPKWLVLEVGVGHPGDMRRTASWLKTDVVIITAIGETPAHIEFFTSRKHLIEEKSKLIKTLKKPARNASSIADAGGGGFLILNADDEDVSKMKNLSKSRIITYGFKEGADILGSGVDILYATTSEPTGIIFRVDSDGKSLPVIIEGVFGRNHVYASMAALALSSVLKLNMLEAIDALKNYDVPSGRMRLLKGINDSMIIDDTYNSSPFACESALETLREVKFGERKIAVLGDMLELGKHTVEAHKNIGRMAKEKCDALVVVGPRAKAIKEGALETGMNEASFFEFLDSSQAGEFMKTFIQKGDLVLVKGSQGMRMERVVEAILFDKENKNKLLVRQDDEWLKKK